MGLYYVTTPIYYVNAEPHAGSAYTTVYADALARYHRLIGDRTFFLTGTDEHGQNILKVANEKGINPQEFVDQMAQKFKDAWRFMRISNDDFIRTTEPRHEKVVQRVIEIMYEKGDIYLGTYQGWYCPKCETYYGENELENGNCPIHKTPVEFVSEESYFFKWSKYQDPLLELYRTNPDFVVPATRLNEIKSFVERGLKDISVSRTSVPWGIPVPFDAKHTVYVWYDALINYISALGYTDSGEKMEFWPGVHLIGKDILRHHAALWPAMLMSLELPVPKRVVAHGWWLVSGQKMSKSVGNIFSPQDLVSHIENSVGLAEDIAVDALRYFMLAAGPQRDDADLSLEALWGTYNADLANDYGNLLHRVLGFMKKKGIDTAPRVTGQRYSRVAAVVQEQLQKYHAAYEKEDVQGALSSAPVFTVIVTILLALSQRILSLEETMDAFTEGAASMVPALMILTLAWTISGVIADVGTAQFLVGTLSSRLPAFAVAPLVLLVASLVSFATGTSWGTMAIVMPLAIPLAYNVSPSILTLVVGSVLGGAIFGDHCSPISDTTIMASMSSACDHIAHVKTQLPYALSVQLVCLGLYFLGGFISHSWVLLLIGSLAIVFIVRFLGKPITQTETLAHS